MRTLFPLMCLVLCGCGPQSTTNSFSQEVMDVTGTNQLALIYVITGRSLIGSRVDYEFDSLAWRTKSSTNWQDNLVISKAAFQAGSPRRRWVSQIHSLDAATGIAIIKVAEESPPRPVGTRTTQVDVVYSWREWSLLTNGEVRIIRTCADPFEKF